MENATKLNLILKKLTNRFIGSILLFQSFLIILAIVIAVIFVHFKIEKYVMADAQEKMLSTINLISNNLTKNHLSLDNGCPWMVEDNLSRYTIFDEEGEALCDSFRETKGMKNHSNKKEIIAARRYGTGVDVHFSSTTKFEMLYVAKKIEVKGKIVFIRLATSLVKIQETIFYLDKIILIILLPVLIISILLGAFVGFKTNKPLNSVLEKIFNIKTQLSPQTYGENWPSSVQTDPWPILEKMLNDTGKDVGELLNKYKAENIKLNTLMNNIPDAIVYTNVNGKILFCNNAFADFFLHGESFIEVLNIKDIIRDKTFNEYADRCLSLGEQQNLNEFKVADFDHEESSYFKTTFIPLKFDEKSSVSNLLIIFHDLTEIKLAANMREDFVSNVSHEVKTPLASLKGYMQLGLQSATENNLVELLNKMNSELNRTTELFNDLLNLSELEATSEFEMLELSPEMLTENAISELKRLYQHKNIKVDSEYAVEKIVGNERMLEQMIINLVKNAFMYTPDNGTITISWKLVNGLIEFLVSDSGIGISSEHLNRIFERFYRVDSSRSKELGGTGLGLSIVKHVVLKHHGKLSVESKLGSGTTFKVQFKH